jgi:hypothetical protein
MLTNPTFQVTFHMCDFWMPTGITQSFLFCGGPGGQRGLVCVHRLDDLLRLYPLAVSVVVRGAVEAARVVKFVGYWCFHILYIRINSSIARAANHTDK